MTFTEAGTIQADIVARLVGTGWVEMDPDDLVRNDQQILIEDRLRAALIRLNPLIAARPERADEIIAELHSILYPGEYLLGDNERFNRWMLGQQSHQYAGTTDRVQVHLIDFDQPLANDLVVAREVSYRPQTGARAQRYDIVLFVNGIPLVVGETKNPTGLNRASWDAAVQDLLDYQAGAPKFFVPSVLLFGCNGRQFRYGAVGDAIPAYTQWNTSVEPVPASPYERCVRDAGLLLNPVRLLEILQRFVLFDRPSGGNMRKVVPRYPQVEALPALLDRAADPRRLQALVWHHQGSGKTLLMAFLARALQSMPQFDNPTVVVVLDRVDLVNQVAAQFHSVGLTTRQPDGINALRDLLSPPHPYRGIILTTVHKFQDLGVQITDRAFVLVDECHRSQEGDFGAELHRVFPRAHRFGFTGTPVLDSDHDTWDNFGDPDDPGHVIHRYTVEQSVDDGMTLPIVIQPVPVEIQLGQDAIDQANEAAIADLSPADRSYVERNLVATDTLLATPDYVHTVVRHIVQHFIDHIKSTGLKAQVVVNSQELCRRFCEQLRDELARVGDDSEVAVVMSRPNGKQVDPGLLAYVPDEHQEEEIKNRFRDHRDPLRFLVVTAKLLTGFDAPIEGVMYLDRRLKSHNLFQAVCRTNRLWTNPDTGERKPWGMVVDYLGIARDLQQALTTRYAGAKTGLLDVDLLDREYESIIRRLLTLFTGIDRSAADGTILMQAQRALQDPAALEDFHLGWQTLIRLCPLLAERPVLRKYTKDHEWLARVYASLQTDDGAAALRQVRSPLQEAINDNVERTHLQSLEQVEGVTSTVLQGLKTYAPGPTAPVPENAAELLSEIQARVEQWRLEKVFPPNPELGRRLQELADRQLVLAISSADLFREWVEVFGDAGRINATQDGAHPSALISKLQELIGAQAAGAQIETRDQELINQIAQVAADIPPRGAHALPRNQLRDIHYAIQSALVAAGYTVQDDLHYKLYGSLCHCLGLQPDIWQSA